MTSHLAPLISDLALILILAAVTTLLFKWLKQPVVLGYIVAGILAGNHFGLVPNISDPANIQLWAEIGIIFLLFGLGLEFSFKKLVNVGGSSLIGALVIVVAMMACGFSAGQLLGWNTTDSVFLGGMLSMSSTTIIIKAFNDLGLQKRKFTGLVFGVLIVEDLFAVLLMVLLSSIYVGQNIDTVSMGESIFKLIFFMILWFGVGIYLIPTAIAHAKRYLNGETLLIVSLGLCLGMVVMANYAGLSSALGAFIMGSILAETIEAKAIDRVTHPIRDLFGAVFFVSVGMLVDPAILVEYWFPIVIITLIVIVGQICFSTLGMLVSGQSLRHSIQAGFSLAQIGEFAFIIATLGLTLGVTSHFLYPIAVAVSVITTFLTPFLIRLSDPALAAIERHMPPKLKIIIERYSISNSTANSHSDWRILLGGYAKIIIISSILLGGVVLLSTGYLTPFILTHIEGWMGQILATVIVLLIMAPLIWMLAFKSVQSKVFVQLWTNSHFNRGLIVSLIILRFFMAFVFVISVLVHIYSLRDGVLFGMGLLVLIMALFWKRIQRAWAHFEVQFTRNLSANSHGSIIRVDNNAKNLHMTHVTLSADSQFMGLNIGQARLRERFGITVISIQRGSRTIIIPSAHEMLLPADELTVVGPEEALRTATPHMEHGSAENDIHDQTQMAIRSFWIHPHCSLIGTTVARSGIRQELKCLVVSIERADGAVLDPEANLPFLEGDVVWFAGENSQIEKLIKIYK